MRRTTLISNSDGLARIWLITVIILSVLLVAGLGYFFGKSQAEADAEAKTNQQVQALEEDLEEAKARLSSSAQDGQDTMESLESENAELRAANDEKDKKIADLEEQLEEANSEDTTTPPTTQ